MSPAAPAAATIEQQWNDAWPKALECWSRFTQLGDPLLLPSDPAAQPYGMTGEIAAIRLVDQKIMVNMAQVRSRELAGLAVPILAHEIGHHIYVPGNLTDNGRLVAAMAAGLTGLRPDAAPLAANLYGDMLINDRLQRVAGLDMAAVYRQFTNRVAKGTPSRVWMVYTRSYEHLWRMKPGTLCAWTVSAEMDADAALMARLIRHFAGDWMRGARRFAAILYAYLLEDETAGRAQTFVSEGMHDTKGAGRGAGEGDEKDAVPDGLTSVDPSELGEAGDFDENLEEELGGGEGEDVADARGRSRRKARRSPENTEPTDDGVGSRGQFREPFQYGELLRALGLNLSDHEITTRYYRERALPYLIPFPARKSPQSVDPVPEGYTMWEMGDPIEDLDLFGTILVSPNIVPGVTTVERVYGEAPGSDPAKTPMDLDIYVDSSGSMPNPAVNVSYLSLAAAILALSALRAGARVQATVWSGAGQFDTTGGFIRDEKRVLGIVTGYIYGGTAFPLNVLRDTYADRKPSDPTAHIVVISDDGVDTMLEKDEKGTPGIRIAGEALNAARGGGTLALNLFGDMPTRPVFEKLGFRVHKLTQWEELLVFARAFVRDNYER